MRRSLWRRGSLPQCTCSRTSPGQVARNLSQKMLAESFWIAAPSQAISIPSPAMRSCNTSKAGQAALVIVRAQEVALKSCPELVESFRHCLPAPTGLHIRLAEPLLLLPPALLEHVPSTA